MPRKQRSRRLNPLWFLDVFLLLGSAAVCALAIVHLTDWPRIAVVAAFVIAFAYFAYRLFLDRPTFPTATPPRRLPATLHLLNEDGQRIGEWSMVGRVSLIIGKHTDDRLELDVDLTDSSDATFIEAQHAVINYAGGDWYIEDLYSQNGVRVQKVGEATAYRLTRNRPCKIEPGDMIFIANTRLLVS